MKSVMTWVGRAVLLVVVLVAGLAFFGPREAVDLQAGFDPAEFGSDLDAYFAKSEARFDDITEGTQKRVIWAGEPGAVTPVSVVYIHGFSATSEEIRPVPDRLAEALGANLVYTRLAGHGRSGAAMAEPTAGDWMRDTAEALAAGRAVGERVIVLSVSTGGTLVAAAAVRPDLMERVAGTIFVSPNFAINNPAAAILTWPGARYWGPVVAGAERSFEAQNADHETYWTTQYPTVAVLPMAALVQAVDALDLGQAQVPALFMFSDADKVVSPEKTREMAEEWGGESQLILRQMGPGDDENAHVIAGDILSPGQTEGAIADMLAWSRGVLSD